ncbi:MAG: hypothetical protein MMC33_001885 [Icmadophila ericetorum]|nr:hypothetical protein [Icmadophila ericetorum]
MRPLRLVIVLFCFVTLPVFLIFFSLFYSHPRDEASTQSIKSSSRTGITSFFSFHTPSFLFPPSAVISLTDDNLTFFLARAAAFGPLLPQDGLTGQLWVGSGFGDDNLARGGAATGAEGELGCSDVPGWESQYRNSNNGDTKLELGATIGQEKDGKQRRSETSEKPGSSHDHEDSSQEDDGTDDYLHNPLPESQLIKPGKPGQSAEQKDISATEHADIQSLQESAEISGKIVILSRGGCGFLEKVKWAQRRGGVALIVGDNEKGGELIQMYAKGDTSNVTIPSLFTSRTTAHLLSSLIPREGQEDILAEDGPSSDFADSGSAKTPAKKNGRKGKDSVGRPTFTQDTGTPKSTNIPQPTIVPGTGKQIAIGSGQLSQEFKKKSWIRSLASAFGMGGDEKSSGLSEDSRRPPSSGRQNWMISDDWDDEPVKTKGPDLKAAKPNKSKASKAAPASKDDFQIGIQDWRDPDLVGHQGNKFPTGKGKDTEATQASNQATSQQAQKSDDKKANGLAGGSITPGSGEYRKAGNNMNLAKQAQQTRLTAGGAGGQQRDDGQGWLSRILWGSRTENMIHEAQASQKKQVPRFIQEIEFEEIEDDFDEFEEHEGLWVTLTPTTMSTSPFFDTLLVLVVSPLVTLTVVYALLLIRSRIRRRRWRAPKSVVDRLPVRTYQTMSASSSSSSAQVVSPTAASPETPLLQSNPQSIISRSRPRSRTTSVIDEAASSPPGKPATKASPSREKPATPPKKKRYAGKQTECVVCLEEYIDGQSRVMSLPCGHEFHADCITPWLTTRRRTCPICKGDVVRSMAQNPFPTPQPSPTRSTYHSNNNDSLNEEDIQIQAAETVSDSPSAAIPIPRSPDQVTGDGDLEQGVDDMAATLVNDSNIPGSFSPSRRGWRGLASLSLSAFSGEAAWRRAQEERNR